MVWSGVGNGGGCWVVSIRAVGSVVVISEAGIERWVVEGNWSACFDWFVVSPRMSMKLDRALKAENVFLRIVWPCAASDGSGELAVS